MISAASTGSQISVLSRKLTWNGLAAKVLTGVGLGVGLTSVGPGWTAEAEDAGPEGCGAPGQPRPQFWGPPVAGGRKKHADRRRAQPGERRKGLDRVRPAVDEVEPARRELGSDQGGGQHEAVEDR